MWFLAVAYSPAAVNTAVRIPVSPPLDHLMLFGFMSAVFTLVCLAHVYQYRAARLLLAIALVLQAIFVFLDGAWPAGLVALVGSGMAVHWWWKKPPHAGISTNRRVSRRAYAEYANVWSESRVSKMFRSTSERGSVSDN